MSYHRKQKENRKLKKLYEETRHSCKSGVYYDKDKSRYIRFSPSHKSSGYPKYLRKVSNKRIRKQKATLNHNSYKKLYDYWWELY